MKKSYKIKEIFYTLQGEGAQSGRPAIFCRFSKCNLWNGKEEDRARSACSFCDTDILGTDGRNGGEYISALDLATAVNNLWPHKNGKPFVVCTGGEPALQLDEDLIENFHQLGFEVAIETNGTLPLPLGIDWICCSPKGSSKVPQSPTSPTWARPSTRLPSTSPTPIHRQDGRQGADMCGRRR